MKAQKRAAKKERRKAETTAKAAIVSQATLGELSHSSRLSSSFSPLSRFAPPPPNWADDGDEEEVGTVVVSAQRDADASVAEQVAAELDAAEQESAEQRTVMSELPVVWVEVKQRRPRGKK